MNAIAAPKRKRSTSSKGATLELRAQRILERDGYLVERATKKLAWINGQPRSMAHDFFAAADLIAIPRKGPVRLVQVTARIADRATKRKQMQPLADHVRASLAVQCEVWCWVPGRKPEGQRFRVQEWNPSGEWADARDEVCGD